MRIVVSACLLGENCKYSGGNNENKAVLNFVKDHELIPVCPEVLGGLSDLWKGNSENLLPSYCSIYKKIQYCHPQHFQ